MEDIYWNCRSDLWLQFDYTFSIRIFAHSRDKNRSKKGRHKLIVYSSDANFHVAGDGKLGGILEPNDMKCHLSEKERLLIFVFLQK